MKENRKKEEFRYTFKTHFIESFHNASQSMISSIKYTKDILPEFLKQL